MVVDEALFSLDSFSPERPLHVRHHAVATLLDLACSTIK
jgi:hypothetical protein